MQRRRPYRHPDVSIWTVQRLRPGGLRDNENGVIGMTHGLEECALSNQGKRRPAAFDTRLFSVFTPDGDAAVRGRPPELEVSLDTAEYLALFGDRHASQRLLNGRGGAASGQVNAEPTHHREQFLIDIAGDSE